MKVRVSNFSTTNQYLLHDIQVAVDDAGQHNHFEGVPDKEFVRDVQQRGQTEDVRNILFNVLSGVGSITAATSLVAGTAEFVSGVSVYQAAFLPALNVIMPDHTVEQTNHINDFGFSASSASKVIVPTEGSASVIAFVEVRPFEQFKYAWCGNTKIVSSDGICDAGGSSYPSSSSTGNTSKPWKARPFRKWEPAALEILKQHTFVIVGGVHIQELTKNAVTITSIDCGGGIIDLSDTSKMKDGKLTCSLVGTNLDKTKKVELVSGSTKISGDVSDSGTGSSATVGFSASDLGQASGLYKLYVVDDTGKEMESGQSVAFAIRAPSIFGITTELPSDVLDPNSQKPTQEVQIHGSNLDRVASLSLIAKNGAIVMAKPESAAKATDPEAKYEITTSQLAGLNGQSLSLRITAAGDPAKNLDVPVTVKVLSPPAQKAANP